MPNNPDAVKHYEGLARESAELRPPEEFAHPEARDILSLANDTRHAAVIELHSGDREPGATLNKHGRKWVSDALQYFAKFGPGDPDAITLNPDDETQVEVGTMALAAKSECVSDDRPGQIEICKGSMIYGCACRNEARAVIRALKEMKR